MKIYYFTFRSVTHAQRGEQMLNQSGIRAVMLRTPKWMENQGCGYSLRIRTGDPHAISRQLKEKGLQFRRIYLQNPDGTLEEVVL